MAINIERKKELLKSFAKKSDRELRFVSSMLSACLFTLVIPFEKIGDDPILIINTIIAFFVCFFFSIILSKKLIKFRDYCINEIENLK